MTDEIKLLTMEDKIFFIVYGRMGELVYYVHIIHFDIVEVFDKAIVISFHIDQGNSAFHKTYNIIHKIRFFGSSLT